MSNELKVFCSNVRGIVKNWSGVNSFDWGEFDILCFNEVWGIKDYENLSVEGYEIKNKKLRETRRGGGALIFGKKNLTCKPITSPFIEGVIETTAISINKVIIVNIYRPPSGDKTEFLDVLSQFLDTVRGNKLLLMGDFNLNTMGGNYYINTVCDLYDLSVKINSITRVESGTCIDNFLSNITGDFEVSEICIADHQAITCRVMVDGDKSKSTIQHSYRVMKEDNWLMFKQGIHSISIRGNSIDEKWDNLLVDIKNVVENSFPIRKSKKKYIFTMSQGLLKSRDKKNSLLRKYKRGLIDKKIYTDYNKIYRKLIKTEQNNKFIDKLTEAGGSGKKKWAVLKEKLLLKKESEQISEICVDGRFIDDESEIANAFKIHFETCASKLSEGLPTGTDTSTLMEQGNPWSLVPTNENEIITIIKSLKNKNSSGMDQLSNRMLKREPHAFARLIVDLINQSLAESKFPNCLKTAKIIPIFKKGDKTNLNNYRPIALLPVLSKVFEKVVNIQLNKVIDMGFIDDNQFGFRNSHSTEDAVLKFVDKIERDLAKKLHVVTVYVDVSKAFDSCDHQILIRKIGRTGLDAAGIEFFKSYLLNRQQKVIVNEKSGGTFVINIGVGQGTVLGPTFFKIYIMDMHLCTSLFCVKFADDSSFEGSGKTRDEVEILVNTELVKISEWFKNNRLTLHPDKSRVIIHSNDKLMNFSLNGVNIQRSGFGLQEESVKLLGIHIDEKLDWSIHIKNVAKKISKGNYLLWRHKKLLNLNSKKVIYESFVRCHLLYGLSIWGGAKQNKLQPVVKVLGKIWKKFGRQYMHTNRRLIDYKLLKLEDEVRIQENKIVWKWENKKLPKSLLNIIEEKQDRLRGRRFNLLRNANSSSINYRLTKIANTNMTEIMKHKNIESLTSTLRIRALDQYDSPCRTRNCFICRNSV
jgi:hypothetical protein